MSATSFRVKIAGIRSTTFDSIEGLSGRIELIEYSDGDDLVTRKRPGRVSFGDIILKRGELGADAFYRWWYAARSGKLQRRDVAVSFIDANRQVLLQWRFQAWPLAWEISASNARGSGMIALESCTLAVESAELVP